MNQTIQLLKTLRQYAIEKQYTIDIRYQEEENYLMRFANSAISLNTSELLFHLDITAHEGRKMASYGLITSLDKVDEMKAGIDKAVQMLSFVEPLSYDHFLPNYEQDLIDTASFDEDLAKLTSQEKVDYFYQVADGLLGERLQLSGIFSSGVNTIAIIATTSEHVYYSKTSDAQITCVVSDPVLKWELIAEQSAQKKSDLDSQALHEELSFMIDRYTNEKSLQLPIAEYDIIFGRSAIADLLLYMESASYHGVDWKRGQSFLSDQKVGQKVFSDLITLVDDPTERETFPNLYDHMGIERKPFNIFENGVFKGFLWEKDSAEEFNQTPTGHTVEHIDLVLSLGNQRVGNMKELAALPREKDFLYIPYLHYLNFVNRSEGIITGSSRFGALLFKKDGTVEVPYNVRLTLSLQEIFGDKVEWLSSTPAACNVSMSYAARNPTAYLLPKYMKVRKLAISHSNESY